MNSSSTDFKVARVHTAVSANLERRLLIWIAKRLPAPVNSDHLTFLGFVALIGVGFSLWHGGPALALVVPLLIVNWFGDSLDGTLARVRRRERPRYGYYVDHVLDAAGFAAIFGGLTLGGFMSPVWALAFLSAYYLVVIEVALATQARGTFRLAAFGVGPTEMRLLLAAGVVQLMRSPSVTLGGHQWLLFDLGGAIGIAGLLITFTWSAAANGMALYREERLPPERI